MDGEVRDIADIERLPKNKKHDIEVVVDRLVLKKGVRQRLVDSIETALGLSEGILTVVVGREELVMSASATCALCGVGPGDIAPRLFSFNSPYGACPKCGGLGHDDARRPRARGAGPRAFAP